MARCPNWLSWRSLSARRFLPGRPAGERRNEIVTLTHPGRKAMRALLPSCHYDAGIGLRSLEDLREVLAFFEDQARFAACISLPGSVRRGNPVHRAQRRVRSTRCSGTGDEVQRRFALVNPMGQARCLSASIFKPAAGSLRVATGGECGDQNFSFDAEG